MPQFATLTIIAPGLHTLVVDQGRPNCRHLGVPVGGAADRFSWALGNALVGNQPDAAAMEITLAGPTLEADGELTCVLFGAPFSFSSDQQSLTIGKTFTLHPGDKLQIAGAPTGARGYLCVRGGVQTPVILGSRSGLEPVQAGAKLPFESSSGTLTKHRRLRTFSFAWNQEPRTLRVMPGLQTDWFETGAFLSHAYEVTPVSNRMGLRLHGPPLRLPDRELISEPVGPGSVQVTRDGQCIILGVDGQTIGGYPKIAQIVSADVDKLGQLRPGDSIRFVRSTLEEAETLFHQKHAELDEWVTRLLETNLSP
ncbi:MAG TPA: biotin-dependent carboxyltransferase family protein [Gemmataceae bacterium]|nr:biotin-dependent carboxyltransferase family protein [Gemmataceae bacterium]